MLETMDQMGSTAVFPDHHQEGETKDNPLLNTPTDCLYTVTFANGIPTKLLHDPGSRSVTGYSSKEYQYNPQLWYFSVHLDDRDAVLQQISSIAAQAQTSPLEYRIVHKNGDIRWVRNTPLMRRELNGHTIAFDGLLSDITERLHTERLLSESEQRYRAVMEQVAEAIYLVDVNTKEIKECNAAFTTLLGYSTDEAKRLSLYDLIAHPQEDIDARFAKIARKRSHFVSDRRYRCKDGRLIDVEISANSFSFNGQRMICTVARDISVRKAQEQEINHCRRQLRQLTRELLVAEEQERNQLAADLHDDVVQVLGVTKLKLDQALAEGGDGCRPMVEGARSLLMQTISRTRSLSFDLGPPFLHSEGWQAAIRWLADSMQRQVGLCVQLQDATIPRPLATDINIFLFRAIRELLFNAAKHSGNHGVLLRLTEPEEAYISVDVEDAGKGFDARLLEATGSQKGFGLLKLKERLAELGGSFEVISQPEQHTHIRLRVPIRCDS